MENFQQQMNDFVGPELDIIADRMKRGISPTDMENAFSIVKRLLEERLFNQPTERVVPRHKKRGIFAGICEGNSYPYSRLEIPRLRVGEGD